MGFSSASLRRRAGCALGLRLGFGTGLRRGRCGACRGLAAGSEDGILHIAVRHRCGLAGGRCRRLLRLRLALGQAGEIPAAALTLEQIVHVLGGRIRGHIDDAVVIACRGDVAHGNVQLAAALERGEIAVVSGFQGVSPEGGITTLGRGGSDTTAVALAAALDAERCEIYTDVDGIYTADPRIVSGARRLEEIDFRDMLLLAGAGSQVLHDRSVALALANDVEIRLLSSFEPGRGSRVRLLADAERPDYAGVTRSEARSEITLAGRAAGTATLSELVIALSKSGIPVLSGSSGEGWVTVRVAPAQLIPALELTHTAYLKQRAE